MKFVFGQTVVLNCVFGLSNPLLLVYDGELADVAQVCRGGRYDIRFSNGEVYRVSAKELEYREEPDGAKLEGRHVRHRRF